MGESCPHCHFLVRGLSVEVLGAGPRSRLGLISGPCCCGLARWSSIISFQFADCFRPFLDVVQVQVPVPVRFMIIP